jgi:membrane associated rhomboid family serine protease
MNIFIVAIIIGTGLISYKGISDTFFFRKYEFHVGSIRAGEQIRMFTSGFLHADWMHFGFNMLTLYFFAPVVIQSFGEWSFLSIYFGSMLAGSLLTLYLHKEDYYYRAVGASGAVTGIIYASILLYPDMTLYLFFALPIPGYVFGIGYLLYSIYGMKAKNDNIGHTAHFGGAIGGYIITLIKEPAILQENLKMVLLLAVPIIILFYLHKTNKL